MESNIYFNPVAKKRVSEVIYEQIFEKISTKEISLPFWGFLPTGAEILCVLKRMAILSFMEG